MTNPPRAGGRRQPDLLGKLDLAGAGITDQLGDKTFFYGLEEGEETIATELIGVQGSPADIGGYYYPDWDKTAAVMRPSTTFNEALDSVRG